MNICSNPHIADAIIAVGIAAHTLTLWVDHWMSITDRIEHSSILGWFFALFKKKPEANQNGK
jgi:hypothetical protein